MQRECRKEGLVCGGAGGKKEGEEKKELRRAWKKAADRLLGPPTPSSLTPPSATVLTHPAHCPSPPPFVFYVADLTVHPLQTTVNMWPSDDRVDLGTFYIN